MNFKKINNYPRPSPKYIPRVVERRAYNGPSQEGAREYNELKKEMNSLFQGFENAHITVRLSEILEKSRKVRMEVQRALKNKIRTTVSYSAVAKQGPHNPSPIVKKIVPFRHDISRSSAMRDYTKARKQALKEQEDARTLCEAIAQRYAKRVTTRSAHQTARIDFVRAKECREALRLARKIARFERKPKEVKSFPFTCAIEESSVDRVPSRVWVQQPNERKPAFPTSIKQIKQRSIIQEQPLNYDDRVYDALFDEPPKEVRWSRETRRKMLGGLLSRTQAGKGLFAALCLTKIKQAAATNFFDFQQKEFVQPQMDETAHGTSEVAQNVVKGDVVLSEQTGVSTSKPVPSNNVFAQLSSAHLPLEYRTLSSRWLYLSTLVWSHSGVDTSSFILPRDILVKNPNMSNTQLFKIHRFFRGDMIIRFEVNSNKFQLGQLQCNWFYGTQVLQFNKYDNIYSGSQRIHCLLNAGSSNTGELRIPYQHPYPYTPTKGRSGLKDYPLEIGILSIKPINALTCTSSSYDKASITVYVSFENTDFSGIVHRDVPGVFPQMNTVASLIPGLTEAATVAKSLSSMVLDTHGQNRDNPPDTVVPSFFVPQTAQSFSATDGAMEPVHSLRADMRGQVPSTSTSYEQSLKTVQNIFGLVRTIEWNTTHKSSEPLATWDVHPHMDKQHLPKASTDIGIQGYVLPPISVLSQLYGYWRGDIVFRFDIVASQFHTGMLIIGQIPFGVPTDNITLDLLKSSGHQVFDLQQGQQFVYNASYFANRPWWPQRYSISGGHEVENFGPSTLHIMILNPLIAMDNIPEKVFINVYMAAAQNFELAIPIPPALALPWGPTLISPKTTTSTFVPGYRPVYTTGNRFLIDDQGNEYLTWYWNTISDDHTQMIGDREKVYIAGTAKADGQSWRSEYFDEAKTKQYVQYLVASKQHTNYFVPVFFSTPQAAEAYIRSSDPAYALRATGALRYYQSGSVYDEMEHDGKWIKCPSDVVVTFQPYISPKTGGGNEVTPQMDERYTTVQPAPLSGITPAASSQSGLITFGERTPDLKSLLRRWNIYASVTVRSCAARQPRDCPPSAIIKLHPTRTLVQPTSSADYDNRVRDGVIPVVASGFFSYRGGIRVRMVFSANRQQGVMAYIQHRFDENPTYEDPAIDIGVKIRTARQLMDTQYATTVQSLDVNPVVTVEVPWYRMTEVNYLQPYKSDVFPEAWSLGSLYVYLHGASVSSVGVDVYIAMADDMEFRIFQGFPTMGYIHEILPEPQMDPEPEPQGILSTFSSTFAVPKKTTEALDGITSVSEKATEFLSSATARLEELSKSFSGAVEMIKEKAPKASEAVKDSIKAVNIYDIIKSTSTLGMSLLSNVVHMVINPKRSTIIWGTVSTLISVFGFGVDRAASLQEKLDKVYSAIYNSLIQQPQGQSDCEQRDEAGSWASVLFATIVSCCGIVCKPPKSFSDVTNGLFQFGFVSRASMNVGNFVRDNFILVRRLFRKILGYFKTDDNAAQSIIRSEGLIKSWLMDAMTMLDPDVESDVLNNIVFAQKVFELATVGRGLQVLFLTESKAIPSDIKRSVNDRFKDLLKLERKLIDRKVYSVARYEPMCLWLCGSAGTGKSHLAEEFAELWAKEEGWTGRAMGIRTTGNKYWDSIANEPTIYFDDFLTTTPSVDMESFAQFLNAKSSALFNPPYAQAEDKGRFLNFRNIIVSSNFKDVGNMPGIRNEEAYNRRRDILIELQFETGMDRQKFKQQPLEDVVALKGITAWYYPDPCSTTGDARRQIEVAEDQSLKDALVTFVQAKYRDYHIGQAASYQRRSANVISRMNSSMEGAGSLTEVLRRGREAFTTVSNTDQFVVSDGGVTLVKPEPPFLYDFLNRVRDREETPGIQPIDPKARLVHLDAPPKCRYPLPQSYPDSDYDDELDADELAEADSTRILFMQSLGSIYRNEPVPQMETSETVTPEPFHHASWDEDWIVEDDLTGDDRVLQTVVEPVKRSSTIFCSWQSTQCHHRLIDWSKYFYDPTANVFYKLDNISLQLTYNLPISVRAGCCQRIAKNENGERELEDHPDCAWNVREENLAFYLTFIAQMRQFAPDVVAAATSEQTRSYALQYIPEQWLKHLIIVRDPVGAEVHLRTRRMVNKLVSRAVQKIKDTFYDKQGRLYHVDRVNMVKDHLKKTIDILWCVVLSIKGVLLALMAIFMSVALFRVFTGEKEETPEPNVASSGDFVKQRHARSMQHRARALVKSEEGHGQLESMMLEDEADYAQVTAIKGTKDRQVMDKILRNAVYVVGLAPQPDGRTKAYKVRCLGLYERKVLFIRHYFEHFKANGVTKVGIVARHGVTDVRYALDELQFEWAEGTGYGVVTLPHSFPYSFLNIVKRYMPSCEKKFQYPARATMVEFSFDDVTCYDIPIKLETSIAVRGVNAQQPWDIPECFSYPWGGVGRCGSLLIAPSLATPLLGVHTAGVGERLGYAELLVRETFIDAECTNVVDYVVPQMEVKDNIATLEGEYQIVGTLDSDMTVHTPNVTKIIPSEIQGVFPIETEPAPLSVKDPRLPPGCDPLREGTSKRCDKVKEFDAGDVSYAGNDLKVVLLRHADPLRQIKPLTTLEAINGFPGIPGYEKIEMSTSEGYPWVKCRPQSATNKSWMFEFDLDEEGNKKVVGIASSLDETLKAKQRMRQLGLVPPSYFTACLKDARILKSKVSLPGKTRVFEISPVDLTIAQRKIMLDFIAAYQNARTRCENTIGINVNGEEWSNLANSLERFSPYILTGDFSGFGPRLSVQCLEIVFDLITEWYMMHDKTRTDEEIQVELAALFHEIVHGLHVYRNLVFRPTSGMPSGNAATVHLNSLVNSLYIRVAYLTIMKEQRPALADLYYFHKHVLFFHNGDDIIISVKPEIIDIFNNETLQEFFARYSIKYTDAMKSGEIRKYCSLEEATYLKCAFVRHPFRSGQWLAQLDRRSIGDCANWVWKSPNLRESSLLNSEQACRLAYGNGKSYYRFVAVTLQKAWAELGVDFRYPLWESLDAAVWDRTEGPKFLY